MSDDAFPPAWIEGLLAGLGLNALLRMPEVLLGTLSWNLAYLWEGPLRFFSLDLFVLVSLLALIPLGNWARTAQRLVVGSVGTLLVYETYESLVTAILHRQPLFYADASQIIGGGYLLLNAGHPWQYTAGIGGGAAGIGVLWWGLPRLVRRLHAALRTPSVARGLLVAHLVIWPLVSFAAITNRGIERQTYQEICLSTTECIVHNARESLVLSTELARRRDATADSTYAGYAELDWQNPPSLYVVVLESYGASLQSGQESSQYDRLMGEVEATLRPSGWHAASTQSEAPVFGGLSWLSVATMLLGTPVDHQPTFDLLRPTLPRYPHLVRTLHRQGYRTALLQPPVRARPGLSVGNPYEFDRTFYQADLDYRGPAYGWGIVPDQYSLAVAHDRFVSGSEPPVFLLFETVTSHAPWDRPPPPFLADPMDFNGAGGPTREAASQTSGALANTPAAPGGQTQAGRLLDLFRYDWRVLTDYLRTQAPPNSLVVVVGDHQPYFAEGETSATPLHVLSREEALVRRFEAYGFVRGLYPSSAAATLHHAGLYSLLVRVLTAHDRAQNGRADAPLPLYHPEGVDRAALLSNNPR